MNQYSVKICHQVHESVLVYAIDEDDAAEKAFAKLDEKLGWFDLVGAEVTPVNEEPLAKATKSPPQ
jgi:hypothetical protein